MIATMSAVAFAMTAGDIYKEDDGLYDYALSYAVPGETVYIYITDTEPDDSKAKNELECVNNSEDNIVKLIPTTSLSIVKRKYDSSPSLYGYFAVVPVKSVSASEYVDDDGYNVSGYIEVDGDEIDVDFDIAYPEEDAYSADFTDELTLYNVESGEDVEIEFDNGGFYGEGSRDTEVLAALDTDYNSTIGNKYPNADLDFYTFEGANFTNAVKSGSYLLIEADDDMYLYSLSGSTLTDLTNTYDDDEDGFVVKTKTLGTYIVSDSKLSSVAASSSSSTSSQSSSSTYVPVNPPTGAAL